MASNAPLFCVRLEYERNQASPPLATQSVGADAPTRDSVRPQARLRKSIVDKSGGRLCQCGCRIGSSCRGHCRRTGRRCAGRARSNRARAASLPPCGDNRHRLYRGSRGFRPCLCGATLMDQAWPQAAPQLSRRVDAGRRSAVTRIRRHAIQYRMLRGCCAGPNRASSAGDRVVSPSFRTFRCTCSLTWQMRLATKLSNPCLIDPMSHQGINIGETISEAEWTKSVKKHQPWALESAGSSPVRCAKNARKHDREGRAQLKRGAAFQEDCAQSGAKTR